METGCRAEEDDDREQVSKFPGVGRSCMLPTCWGDEESSKMGWLIFLLLCFCCALTLILLGMAGGDSGRVFSVDPVGWGVISVGVVPDEVDDIRGVAVSVGVAGRGLNSVGGGDVGATGRGLGVGEMGDVGVAGRGLGMGEVGVAAVGVAGRGLGGTFGSGFPLTA